MSDNISRQAEPEKRTEKRTETHACDCISRQAAIDAVNYNCTSLKDIKRAIMKLPSTDRTGHWNIESIESVWGKGYKLTCSECGDCFTVSEHSLPYEKFCRGCGADMRGVDDENTL